eukprot:CAMPEP_0175318784 /NCGR_PEP_ID=MMETSP0093-20121207/70608_1 /TAXON_ID=311494 /ORGANISM="Alexandrium monilatum, Strain CCMP3105" /LENGTH=93 /DNA_ID=CAMNT_0016615593 /DNA_START=161 /DNA_END=438 /DNA_ORIENTATION=-
MFAADPVTVVGLVDQRGVLRDGGVVVDVGRAEPSGLVQLLDGAAEHEGVLLDDDAERAVLPAHLEVAGEPAQHGQHLLVGRDAGPPEVLHVEA